jgi:hypothetical protein
MKPARDFGRALCTFIALTFLISCANPGVPLPPELELPRRVSDLHASRKGDKVTLSWSVPYETMDHQTIRHQGPTRICRSIDPASIDCDHPVGEVSAASFQAPPKPKKGETVTKKQANYADTLPTQFQQEHATDVLTYAVSALNESGRSAGPSNTVQIAAAPTLPAPSELQAQVTADGVSLHWGNPTPPAISGLRFLVRIYREPEGTKADTVAGEIPITGDSQEWLDRTFEWEKAYQYRAAIVTTVSRSGGPDLQVEGDDTPVVKVAAHDVFPPAVPSGLQAVASGVGQAPFIDLIWAPVADADLAGYNVYRHEEGIVPVKVNADLVKTPAYRDSNVSSGHQYTYSVSAVDLRGNESAHSEEASEKMP